MATLDAEVLFSHHLNLLWSQLEGHRPQVVTQSLLLARSSNGHNVLINAPPQADLSWVYSILLRQTLQDAINWSTSSFGDSRQWAVSRSGNALLLVVLEEIRMLEVRVELDLIDRRRVLAVLEDDVEVLREVVADADGFCKAFVFELLHLLPFGLVFFLAIGEEGSVN